MNIFVGSVVRLVVACGMAENGSHLSGVGGAALVGSKWCRKAVIYGGNNGTSA